MTVIICHCKGTACTSPHDGPWVSSSFWDGTEGKVHALFSQRFLNGSLHFQESLAWSRDTPVEGRCDCVSPCVDRFMAVNITKFSI